MAHLLLHPNSANANQESTTDSIPFSYDVASQIAIHFANGINPTCTWDVDTCVPVLDLNGSLKGYFVGLLSEGSPSGYVSLNIDYPGLVASYCLEFGALGQGGRLLQERPATLGAQSIDKSFLIAIDPFNFGLYDELGARVVSYSTSLEASPALTLKLRQRATWDDVLIDSNELSAGNYSLGSTKYAGELAYITKLMATRGCKRYACGPHALYVIGAALPNDRLSAPIIPNATNDWSCYIKLWNYSNTRLSSSDPNGVIYGETNSDRIGPAFVRLCSERATTMRSNLVVNPSFLTLVTHINGSDVAVIGAGIKTPDGDSGHFLACNGYAYIHRKSDNRVLQCAAVFDGWDDHQFFNFDFPNYYFKNLTLLYRKK